jgi:hypothetical protein
MARTTKLVRVALATTDELERMCERARRCHEEKNGPLWWETDGGPSMGEMIDHLVRHMANSKRRQREAAHRRKVRRLREMMTWQFVPAR